MSLLQFYSMFMEHKSKFSKGSKRYRWIANSNHRIAAVNKYEEDYHLPEARRQGTNARELASIAASRLRHGSLPTSAANKSSSASNASRASSISHSSILKEKSFLSVNQPTSGASSDSEAGKSSSTPM